MAAANPGKVKEMCDLMFDASVATRMVTPRPSVTGDRHVFEFHAPVAGLPRGTRIRGGDNLLRP